MIASCLLVIALGFAEESSPAAAMTMKLHPIETDIVAWTNAQRAQAGLTPLTIDQGLVDSARGHAAWMTNSHTLRHTTANVAENIAMGQRSTSEVVTDWMHSSGHRANIMNPNHRRIGVAAYTAADGTIFWCQQFLN